VLVLQATMGNFKLIDFGSMRNMKDMKDINPLVLTDVFCTYPFCPPEALAYDCPMPLSMTGAAAIDAYSLGATIYYTVFGTYLYDCHRYSSKADARKLFAKGKIVVPIKVTVSCRQVNFVTLFVQ
jgi:serine/threonine protein kinase